MRLSLVSIPVALYTATKAAAKISFNQIHEPSGKRVRHQKMVPGIGPVDPDEIIKGYEYERGKYVLLTEDEIDEVKLETRKTLELTQFVGACEIDPIYFDRPYFVVPQDELAEDAFRVVRDALRETEKIGLGQLAMRGREYVVAVKPCGTGLLAETLRFEEEIRKTDPYFEGISAEEADQELLALAKELIQRKVGPFEASVFENRYEEALRELIDRKRKSRGGKVTTTPDEEKRPAATNVVDLRAALKGSLGGREAGKKGNGREAPKKGKKPASQTTKRKRKSA